jgi:hypothetical protein
VVRRLSRGEDAIEIGFAGEAVLTAEQLLDGKALAALGSPRSQHIAAVLGGHALEKAVYALPGDALRLPGPFHNLASITALGFDLELEVLGMLQVLDPLIERFPRSQLDQVDATAFTGQAAVVTFSNAAGVGAIGQLQNNLSHRGKRCYQTLDNPRRSLYCYANMTVRIGIMITGLGGFPPS